ncbi:MAG TPA: hypothetical protein VFM88_17340 [Vicinamibacteria bacterium]|nr:hypothetical protein [Vicinamibacteria bacterium]
MLPEIHEQPYAVRQEYLRHMRQAMLDEGGRDELLVEAGLSGAAIQGPGFFEGATNPGIQVEIDKAGLSDDELRSRIEAYASAVGLVLNQDAMAYHQPVPGPEAERNMAEARWGKTITEDEITAVYAELRTEFGDAAKDVYLVFSREGVRLINGTGAPNDEFHDKAFRAIEQALPHDFEYGSFKAFTDCFDRGGKDGKGYKDRIGAGRSDLQRAVDRVGRRTAEVNRRWAERLRRKEEHRAARARAQVGRPAERLARPSAAELDAWHAIHEIAERAEPAVRRALLAAIKAAQGESNPTAVAKAIEKGATTNQVLARVWTGIGGAALSKSLSTVMSEVISNAGQAAIDALAEGFKSEMGLSFTVHIPRAFDEGLHPYDSAKLNPRSDGLLPQQEDLLGR